MGMRKVGAGALFAAVIGATWMTGGVAGAAGPGAPGAPTSVTAVPVNGAIAVSWSAPASEGESSITGYKVTATSVPATGSFTCTTTGTTTCLVTGLTNGRSYSTTVKAINAAGGGTPSSAVHTTPTVAQNCSYLGPDANLQHCNLTGAALTDADLSGADLKKAEVGGVDLTGANLSAAVLSGTDLSGATLAGVTSGGITGTPAALPNFWSVINGYLIGPEADLIGAKLKNADLSSANLTDATLTGAKLSGTNLAGANLTYITSGGVTGTPATLPSGWDLVGGYLIGAYVNLAKADLDGLDLAGSTLTGVTSGGVTGTPAALPTNWSLIGGYLLGPDDELQGADLAGLDLTGVDLAGSYISYADVDFTNFTDANLTGAGNMTTVDLDTAIWSNTICPDGINSNDSGGSCNTDI